MSFLIKILGVLFLCSLFSFNDMTMAYAQTENQNFASREAVLLGADGKRAGTVILKEGPNGVVGQLRVEHLPQGAHAVHFHQTGSCALPDFKSAGGHLNPNNVNHGFYAEGGPHPGDLPNIYLAQEGSYEGDFYNDRVTIKGENGKVDLLDEDGSALVIHAEAGDYVSKPSGAAGDRIACAEIKQ